MKSAEEYISTWKDIYIYNKSNIRMMLVEHAIVAINKAREEAIEECAKVVKLNHQQGTLEHRDTAKVILVDTVEWNRFGKADYSYERISVNKQSILNLIKELK